MILIFKWVLNWKLPDVIIYPAGGGTGLIGIWKGFQEMMQLGWIQKPFPKMIAVQSENCASIVAATNDPQNWKQTFRPKPSIANGLAVPYPFGMKMMQDVIRDSHGMVVTVSEQEIVDGIKEFANSEGLLLSPEGSATYKALPQLKKQNIIGENDSVLLLNTADGYKYLENFKF